MNILHVITGLPTAGAQMALCKLIEQRDKETSSAGVISLMTADGVIRDRILAAGGFVEDLGLRRGQVTLKAAARLLTLARRRPAELIQGWEYHGSLAASIAAHWMRPRRPVVWGVRHSIRDLSNDKRTTRGLIRLGATLSRTTAAIVYCSRASARQHEDIGYDATKTVILPNGFDCDRFRPRPEAAPRVRNELDIPPDRIVIGHVARYDPMKDHANLLGAVARVARSDASVHLVMVGRGADADNEPLAALIRKADVGDRVTLLGERSDITELLAGFDVLALSSSTGEAFPNVLGEAMASGVPCVATDVGDCAWIIGDTGVTVPARDAAALAAGLKTLLQAGQEGRRCRGQAARARIRQNFNIVDVVRRYQSLYERLILT
jgi:glycosyltransferase involved in cell wall biosynthesis